MNIIKDKINEGVDKIEAGIERNYKEEEYGIESSKSSPFVAAVNRVIDFYEKLCIKMSDSELNEFAILAEKYYIEQGTELPDHIQGHDRIIGYANAFAYDLLSKIVNLIVRVYMNHTYNEPLNLTEEEEELMPAINKILHIFSHK